LAFDVGRCVSYLAGKNKCQEKIRLARSFNLLESPPPIKSSLVQVFLILGWKGLHKHKYKINGCVNEPKRRVRAAHERARAAKIHYSVQILHSLLKYFLVSYAIQFISLTVLVRGMDLSQSCLI
jgi:hypothetical protein